MGILNLAMLLSSDPHAWLRPYFAELAQDHTFARLAPSIQFSARCDAVAPEHPAKAAQMREWSPAAQTGTLRWLANVIKQRPPTGLDLRLMKGDKFHRTELHHDADVANAKAAEWKAALLERGSGRQ